jgi:hypothetical protein
VLLGVVRWGDRAEARLARTPTIAIAGIVGALALLSAATGETGAGLAGLVAGLGLSTILVIRRMGGRFPVRMPPSRQLAKVALGLGLAIALRWASADALGGEGLGALVAGLLVGAWLGGGVPFLSRRPVYPPEGGAPPL